MAIYCPQSATTYATLLDFLIGEETKYYGPTPTIAEVSGTITGKTVIAYNFNQGLIIRAAAGEEFNGVIGSGARFEDNTTDYIIEIGNRNVTFQDIEIVNLGVGSALRGRAWVNCIFTAQRCLFKSVGQWGFYSPGYNTGSPVFEDCVFAECGLAGIEAKDQIFRRCTVVNNNLNNSEWEGGVNSRTNGYATAPTLTSCYIGGNLRRDLYRFNNSDAVTYNATSDTSNTDNTGNIENVSVASVIENPGIGDYRIKSSGHPLAGAGENGENIGAFHNESIGGDAFVAVVDSLSSSSQIQQVTPTTKNAVTPNGIISASELNGVLAISQNLQIAGENLNCVNLFDEVICQVVINPNALPMASLTEIGDPNLSIHTQTDSHIMAAQSELDSASIATDTTIAANFLYSSATLDQLAISTNRSIETDNLIAATTFAGVSVGVDTAIGISPDAMTAGTVLDAVTVTAQTIYSVASDHMLSSATLDQPTPGVRVSAAIASIAGNSTLDQVTVTADSQAICESLSSSCNLSTPQIGLGWPITSDSLNSATAIDGGQVDVKYSVQPKNAAQSSTISQASVSVEIAPELFNLESATWFTSAQVQQLLNAVIADLNQPGTVDQPHVTMTHAISADSIDQPQHLDDASDGLMIDRFAEIDAIIQTQRIQKGIWGEVVDVDYSTIQLNDLREVSINSLSGKTKIINITAEAEHG